MRTFLRQNAACARTNRAAAGLKVAQLSLNNWGGTMAALAFSPDDK